MAEKILTIFANSDELVPRCIEAGTRGSFGTVKLRLEFSDEWDGMTKKIVFHPKRGKPIEMPYLGGEIDIPAEVMRYEGQSQYVVSGVRMNGSKVAEKRISLQGYANVEYTLDDRGGNATPVTPESYDLLLAEAQEYIEESLRLAKESGEFDGADGKDGKDGKAGVNGVGINLVRQTATSAEDGGKNVVTVYLDNGISYTFEVLNGSRGRGIRTIERTSGDGSLGSVDEYTITFTDGSTTLYTITNGTDKGVSAIAASRISTDGKYRIDITLTDGSVVSGDLDIGKIPASTSELKNDSGFVGNTVSNLTNYYLKSETYTRDEVTALIAAVKTYTVSVVSELPSTGAEKVIYLVVKADGSDKDAHNEYLWVNGKFEFIGTTAVDLTGYATQEWVNVRIGELITKAKIVEMIGYTPADAAEVERISDDVEEIKKNGTGGGILAETDPTVPAWAKESKKPTYTASEVGADASGTAESKVSAHNVSDESHNDIRLLITGLTNRLNALANSTDEDLDQLAEIVAYIKANKSLIDSVTTNKVSVTDIIDNLTTGDSKKPLSAAQGKALKALYDAIPAWAKESNKPSYSKSDVGLGNVDNVKQYSASNPPPYPVKSVNGKTGAVTLGAADVGAATAAQFSQLSEAKVNGIGIKNLIALTQAEYDALEEKDDTTLYIITDATGEDSGGGNDTPTNMIPYLKSDGVAYVKLEHGHIDNATYEMCFRAENDLETNDAIFGNRYTNIAFKGGKKTDSWISGYYNGSNYATFGEGTIDISKKHIYTITDTSLILDNDIVKEITAGTNTIYTQMYLFASNGSYQNNGEYVAGKSAFTFFYLKIRNSEGELIYNYQPAEDSEGVACIYEAVTKTYLYNVAESGGFVYGTEMEES